MKKPIIVGVAILVPVIIIGALWFLMFGAYTLKGERYLNSKWDGTKDYFNQNNIGNYEEFTFQIHHKTMLIFESDATTLVATYSPEEYQKQVEKIKTEISFLKGENGDIYGDFEMGEWHFEVCDFEECIYPKDFAMIAFCEESNQIAYLEFYDMDLDTLSGGKNGETMPAFVRSYFRYRFV